MGSREMIVTVFRARLRADLSEAQMARLGQMSERMAVLAAQMPGFISYKDFAAGDGEGLTLVEFASEATLKAWRNHPEHQAAQEQGRSEFFSDYQIQVCTPQRAYRFVAGEGRQVLL
jgi:heme-degrading monooxygenase HmoA